MEHKIGQQFKFNGTTLEVVESKYSELKGESCAYKI